MVGFTHTQTLAVLACALVFTLPAAGVPLENINMNWADSYSIGGSCYCQTTFDHEIGSIMVDGPDGTKINVRKACELAGSGPETIGDEKRIYYNTVQCGNEPLNNAPDEAACPGRVDLGRGDTSGCQVKGPKWGFYNEPKPQVPPTQAPKTQPPSTKPAETQVPRTQPPKTQPPSTQAPSKPPTPTTAPKPKTSKPLVVQPAGSLLTDFYVVDIQSMAKTRITDITSIDVVAREYPSGFTIEAMAPKEKTQFVLFEGDSFTRKEAVEPYILSGNMGDVYRPWDIKVGTVEVTVTATGSDGTLDKRVLSVTIQ